MSTLLTLYWSVYHRLLRLLYPTHPVSLALRAEDALRLRSWGAAFDLSNAALKNRADFAPAYFLRGMARLNLDDYKGALRDLNRFLAHEQDPPAEVYFWRGWLHTYSQEWSLALADFERVLAVQPDDPHVHYACAYAHFQRGQLRKTRAMLERLEKAAPGALEAQELWGHLLLQEGQHEAAVERYSRALEGSETAPQLYYNRALAWYAMGQYREAQSDMETILAMEPDSNWVWLELSNFAFEAGNYEQALHYACEARALDPTSFEASVREAAILMALGREADAHALLEEIESVHPNQPVVDQLFGDLLANKGEREAAVIRYQQVLESEPDHHVVRVKLAAELGALERYDEALVEIARVLEEEPDFVDAYATRADIYRYSNQPDKMRADLDYILVLEPSHAWALAFRASHRAWRGDDEGASADYDAALSADSSQAWIWAFRGQFHLQRSRMEAAREDYQQAITLDPGDMWIRRQWAEWLHRAGLVGRAVEVLDSLIADAPDDGFARLFRAELHLASSEWEPARKQLEAIIAMEHELSWLAHAAMAWLVEGEQRTHHLQRAEAQRPAPTFWGVTPSVVLVQQVLGAWLRGEHAEAVELLQEAIRNLEHGEQLWLGLHPLCRRLDAAPLLAVIGVTEGAGCGG